MIGLFLGGGGWTQRLTAVASKNLPGRFQLNGHCSTFAVITLKKTIPIISIYVPTPAARPLFSSALDLFSVHPIMLDSVVSLHRAGVQKEKHTFH